MKFAKMQGTGNDYIYVNCFDESIDDPPAAAKFLSDRHFGIGGDGLIRLAHPQAVSDVNERQIADCAAGDADWFMEDRKSVV